MNSITTSIIPSEPLFYGTGKNLDLRAISVFSALGFFLDSDTFWIERKTLPTASNCLLDADGNLLNAQSYFKWHYAPRQITFAQAVEEFGELYEEIIKEQIAGRKVILPLSGGLDSRTQAAALKNIGADVHAFSYAFDGGHDETFYSGEIARAQSFPFERWKVEPGYLWKVIDRLAQINQCYSEFTHPRQMAFLDRYKKLGEVFSLGHWGDVLFDDMGVADSLPFDEQVNVVLKKIVKKGGLGLAKTLWEVWGLEGDFEEYLRERIRTLLSAIDIPNSANARIRAFKSLYWATRWTSVNLAVFRHSCGITLPYYDNRMCEFICTVPEEHLSGRKIQIEYLKRRAPQLAKITWQDHRPFNLYNYKFDRAPWNLPYRVFDKARRSVNPKKNIQRNWELQFWGEDNDLQLKKRLFDEPKLKEWVPEKAVLKFYEKFKTEDPVFYSHSVSMLLTLSLFSRYFLSSSAAVRQAVFI